MIKIIITLILSTLCGNSFAYDGGDINEWFSSMYEVSAYSTKEVRIINKQHPEILNKIITVGTQFQGYNDGIKHILYVLKSFKGKEVTFEYFYRYDARSLGGSFEKRSGEVTVDI